MTFKLIINKLVIIRNIIISRFFNVPQYSAKRKRLMAMLLTGLLVSIIITGYAGESRASVGGTNSQNTSAKNQLTVLAKDQAGQPVQAKIEIYEQGTKLIDTVLDNSGVIKNALDTNHIYNLALSLDGYKAVKQDCTLDKDTELNIILEKIPVPKVAVVPVPVVAVPAPQPAQTPVKQPVSKPRSPAQSAPKTTEPPAELRTDMSVAGILDQINYQRQSNGLGMVSLNSILSAAAMAKATDMVTNNYFTHTSPAGIDDFYFINQSGYSWQAAGINLAEGDFGSGKDLVDAWMNSAGHRANILASFGRQIGIAINGKYFVMMIANPR